MKNAILLVTICAASFTSNVFARPAYKFAIVQIENPSKQEKVIQELIATQKCYACHLKRRPWLNEYSREMGKHVDKYDKAFWKRDEFGDMSPAAIQRMRKIIQDTNKALEKKSAGGR